MFGFDDTLARGAALPNFYAVLLDFRNGLEALEDGRNGSVVLLRELDCDDDAIVILWVFLELSNRIASALSLIQSFEALMSLTVAPPYC